MFEYDSDWLSLGTTAISTAEPPPAGQHARVEIRFDTWGRGPIRCWSPSGLHLVHTRILRAHRIAQLRAATRTIATPHGWATMVWRGRRMPAIAVGDP
ncbi:hypothetical protein SMD20_39675 [Nonomuraea sp. LP-02]|uniref:hypothetical protein n=1 Tax=Nonomuraea sp. LP-02 TaxID=3097960 RepID=UPI002E323766|nr:hypothetical protein [Nonomuraea sp. LP-02]MED7930403.1 hypothetical protein [Nonomuraea sp. LP-02]